MIALTLLLPLAYLLGQRLERRRCLRVIANAKDLTNHRWTRAALEGVERGVGS